MNMSENENKYLSLKIAAGLYGYTRDHLGLMIRQGKLKGIKLGSYYVTTNKWMADYLKGHANPDHPIIAGKFSNKFLTQALEVKENIVSPQANISNKFDNNSFSKIQKELLSSFQELSAARDKTDVLPHLSAQHYVVSGNQYLILPIRKMEESEREEIFRKISNYDKLKDEREMT